MIRSRRRPFDIFVLYGIISFRLLVIGPKDRERDRVTA